MNKYKLLKEDFKINFLGVKLFRIRALVAFGNVVVNDLGGYIEKEENLSHCGEAWVYGEAEVSGEAKVYGEAKVSGAAEVYGEAKVYGEAEVYGEAKVYGEAEVYGEAKVYGEAEVYGKARVLFGYIKFSLEDTNYSLMAQLGVSLINREVILYKKVTKISKGKYCSNYDNNFIYEDNKIAEVVSPDLSDFSCTTGIHLSSALYWDKGDTLIACKVKEEDIITIQQGKARVKKCLVLGEVKI